jgi:replicative DNA helicase
MHKANLISSTPMRDSEAERGVIGGILLNETRSNGSNALDNVQSIVKPEMFYDDAHQRIMSAIFNLRTKNKKIDVTLVIAELRKLGDLEVCGGSAYVMGCVRDVQNDLHTVAYAKVVRELFMHRQINATASKLVLLSNDEGSDSDEIMQQADEMIFQLRDTYRVGSDRVSGVSSILMECIERLDRRAAGESMGLATGFCDLDKMLRLAAGDFIVLAARPSMGKTAFALNIVQHIAKTEHVMFFSLEMDSLSLMDRLLSASARVPLTRMRDGTMTPAERKQVLEAASDLSERGSITIDDTSSRTVWDIASVCRRQKRKEGLGLVVIDYLQLLTAVDRKIPRQEQVANMTRSLKNLARELEVPVICLAQLNRQTETDGDRKPKLRHLRESGAIEQDADVVMFVHRDGYYDPNADQNTGEILLSKQRNGMLGSAKLTWLKDIQRFENTASELARQNHNPEFD